MARPKTKSLAEQVQEELNNMQMTFIKECSSVEEVQHLIEVFSKMNSVAKELDSKK